MSAPPKLTPIVAPPAAPAVPVAETPAAAAIREAGPAAEPALGDLFGVGVALIGALALTTLLRRLGRARAFRRIHRALPAAQVLVWTAALGRAVAVLGAPLQGGSLVLGALVLGVVGLAALPLLRDVFAGLAFALERRWAVGDDVRIGAVEGRIIGLGVRSLRLRARDGTESAVPFALVQSQPIIRLALAALDAPCEFNVHVPADMAPERAIEVARLAAVLSPFASPRCRPEVFLGLEPGGGLSLRIRGFVFDRDHEERYRSDVNARLFAAFAGGAGELGDAGEGEAGAVEAGAPAAE